MEKNSVTGGRNIMATEAQNIMQAFRASEMRDKVKEEERMLKKGPLGYVGGVAGFVEDTTGGVLGAQTAMNVLTTIENIRDPRSFETMVSDIKNELSGEFEAMSQKNLQQLKDFYVQSTETEVDLYNSAIEITER
jgi:hypothetical protein